MQYFTVVRLVFNFAQCVILDDLSILKSALSASGFKGLILYRHCILSFSVIIFTQFELNNKLICRAL